MVKFANSIEADVIFSYTLTLGTSYRMLQSGKYRPGERNYPLYYFQNYTQPPLQNPYRWSVSGGGNYVVFLTRKLNNRQAVGFLNVHADRLQISYINDGPPFIKPIGDRKDRYFTGGALITYHMNDDAPFNLFEVSYGKFTGYSPSAYELSNKLGHSYIYYKDVEENYYNKSSLTFSASNTARVRCVRNLIQLSLYGFSAYYSQ
ncbi:hypothetical protein MKQ70_02705 [Chitinophaga sedimenti]|uniref:hypothetical protein n=1 Tax=Chitinophaga sedimenti TaxID=2033606 RepID=UPI0020037DC1|nr:hypothetical protein [Chitinophaga sedimenti]MCK7553974.1 hypothetical protein [Chitinophaga sedimenti]